MTSRTAVGSGRMTRRGRGPHEHVRGVARHGQARDGAPRRGTRSGMNLTTGTDVAPSLTDGRSGSPCPGTPRVQGLCGRFRGSAAGRGYRPPVFTRPAAHLRLPVVPQQITLADATPLGSAVASQPRDRARRIPARFRGHPERPPSGSATGRRTGAGMGGNPCPHPPKNRPGWWRRSRWPSPCAQCLRWSLPTRHHPGFLNGRAGARRYSRRRLAEESGSPARS